MRVERLESERCLALWVPMRVDNVLRMRDES